MNIILPILFLFILTFSDAISLQARSFLIRLLVNSVTKFTWLAYLLFYPISQQSQHGFFLLINIVMLIFALLALQEDNSKRFFTLSNVAQMCVLTNFSNTDNFLIYFILFLSSNIGFLAIMSIIERKTAQKIVYIEAFWGLIDRSKVYGLFFAGNLLILAGLTPIDGLFRYILLFDLYTNFKIAIFWLNFVSLFALGYAYMRWILATLLRKQVIQNFSCPIKEIWLQNIFIWIGLATGLSFLLFTLISSIS